MSGSFDANERAIGAMITLDTLTNMVIESPQQSFSKESILRLAGWMKDAVSGVEEPGECC